MTRFNLILFMLLIVTALGVVTAQYQARKLYSDLQQQQDAVKQYDVEWGQLQLEQSTWAMHSRIEQIATRQLHMQLPDAKHIQLVSIPLAADTDVNGSTASAQPMSASVPVSNRALLNNSQAQKLPAAAKTTP